jgi:uncharacterized membrane protein (DUF106 family)
MVSGFQVFIDSIFNPVFGWMLKIPPILAIIILALLLGLISTLLQKYLTDQARMKRLRDDTKKYQEQMKKVRDKPEQMMKIQQKILPIQMELMKESFKPLLVSLIPFLLIFFWLSNHLAYHPITPEQPFVVSAEFDAGVNSNVTLQATPQLQIEEPTQQVKDGTAQWRAKGPAGEYNLTLVFPGGVISPVSRPLLITDKQIYEAPMYRPDTRFVTSFNVENEKLVPLPWVNIFGWHPGWIFYYIIFSIPLSLLLKKWLDVV